MEPLNQRIKEIIEKYFAGNQSKFAKSIDMSQSYINQLVGTKAIRPSEGFINRLLQVEIESANGTIRFNPEFITDGITPETIPIKVEEPLQSHYDDKIFERFQYLVNTVGKHKSSHFSKNIDYTYAAIDSITSQRTKPGFQMMYRIINRQWDLNGESVKVNPLWLFTGIGKPFIKKEGGKFLTFIKESTHDYNIYDKMDHLEELIKDHDNKLNKINDIINYQDD